MFKAAQEGQIPEEHQNRFELQDGLLIHKKEGQQHLYIPENFRLQIMQENHDTLITRHFGLEKTYDLIKRSFW